MALSPLVITHVTSDPPPPLENSSPSPAPLSENVRYVSCQKHRDIKLENICFESMADDAEVKLVDFGLSASFKVRVSRAPHRQ